MYTEVCMKIGRPQIKIGKHDLITPVREYPCNGKGDDALTHATLATTYSYEPGAALGHLVIILP